MNKQKILISFLLLFSFTLLSACTKINQEKEIEKELIINTNELKDLSNSHNQFGIDLFLAKANLKENLLLSPYSLNTALTLAYIGADLETKEEMRTILNLKENDILKLKKDVFHLKRHLETISKETEISIANALFLKQGIPFLNSYIESGKNYWQAELNNLPNTGDIINEWVKNETREKIEEIIDPGPIDPLVIAYLVNAIYFKADWKNNFKENLTRTRPFYSNNEISNVDMMENKANYYYLIDDEIEVVRLDYSDEKFSFYAIMPNNLEDFQNSFNKEYLNKIKSLLTRGELTLRLPKFKLEEKFKLSDVLEIMGMRLAFNPQMANFSKMVDLEKLNDNVYISEVYHSTFIEVDEKGTEAAAATAIEMSREMAVLDPLIIEFNRPFIFLIEEKETGTILFIGQLININN